MLTGKGIKAFSVKSLAWLCAAMLIISVLPLYAISFYSHPHYDDYGFSADVRHTWEDTGSITAVLKTVVQSAANVRDTWQGTYLGTILSNVQPGVFSEDLYFLTTFILLTALLLCFGFFFYTMLKVLLDAAWYENLCMTSLALFLMVQLMPEVNEGLYWFNGGIGNTFVYSLIALSLALMIRLWRAERKRAWWVSAALFALMIALGGGSYGGGLFLLCMMALVVFYAMLKKNRFRFVYAGLMLVLALCFAYSMAAPGNDARAVVMGSRISAVEAVLKSVYYGVSLIGSYITLPVIAVMLLVAPMLYALVQKSTYSFRYPLLVLLLGIGLFSVQLVPPMYSGVFIGGGRIQNTYYFSFIVMFLAFETYLLGYAARRMNNSFVFSNQAKRWIAFVSVALFAFGVLGFYRVSDESFTVKNLTGVEAIVSIVRGEAEEYDEAMDEREAMLNDDSISDVILTPLDDTPKTFMADSLSTDIADDIARLLEVYYRKNSVTVADE